MNECKLLFFPYPTEESGPNRGSLRIESKKRTWKKRFKWEGDGLRHNQSPRTMARRTQSSWGNYDAEG